VGPLLRQVVVPVTNMRIWLALVLARASLARRDMLLGAVWLVLRR
jgi:hypothetical protein